MTEALTFATAFMRYCTINGYTATTDRLQQYVDAVLRENPKANIPPLEDVWRAVPSVDLSAIETELAQAS